MAAKRKRVRIKSCRDSQYWYANDIGRWFELRRVDSEGVWVIDSQGFVNKVDSNDAFISTEPEHDH